MKLKEYLDSLNDLVKENPSALDMEVITAIDDEGNGFKPVYYTPVCGNFDGVEFDSDRTDINSVCLN